MFVISTDTKPTAVEMKLLSVADPKVFETRKLTGAETAVDLILNLTDVAIPAIVAYVALKLRAKSKIKLTYKGLEVQGVSEETIEKVIKRLISSEVGNDK